MDSSKYVNTYLDFAIGMIHEAINEKLQLRTQMKMANDLVAERDQVISALKKEIENIKGDTSKNDKISNELIEEKKKSKQLEDSYHALTVKLSHFDNMTNQFNDIKNQLQIKNIELQSKNRDYESLQTNYNSLLEKSAIFDKEKTAMFNQITILESRLQQQKKKINTPVKNKKDAALPLQLSIPPNNVETVTIKENNDF